MESVQTDTVGASTAPEATAPLLSQPFARVLIERFTDNRETLDFYCAVAGAADVLVKAAIAEECERCANLAENMREDAGLGPVTDDGYKQARVEIAAKIRSSK